MRRAGTWLANAGLAALTLYGVSQPGGEIGDLIAVFALGMIFGMDAMRGRS